MTGTNSAYCVGEDGLILKTINGGSVWDTLSSNTDLGLYSLNFFNENSGWICGDSGIINENNQWGEQFY
ncbi:MAG: hypothetical protein R3A12_11730 [Ignavibacteria bacterium]